jgi:hypothetical protein
MAMGIRYAVRSDASTEPHRRTRSPAAIAAPASGRLPRFLNGRPRDTAQSSPEARSGPPLLVQRDEASSSSPPTAASSTASLLDERLELDPELELMMARLALARMLDPDRLAASVLSLPYLDRPAYLTAPTLPPTAPLVPRGKGPDKARAGKPGDVLSGIVKIPSVKNALDRLKDDAAGRAVRDWSSLSLGGKSLLVTSGVVIGGGAIAAIASDPDARGAVLGLLDGRVLPVPYTQGSLGLELNTQGDNLMLGIHLDVGRWLPKSFGFGGGSAKALGPPPVRRSAVPGAAGRARAPDCGCGGACADCGGLRLSSAGEPEEIEADRVADRILRPSSSPGAAAAPALMRVRREERAGDGDHERIERAPAAARQPTHAASAAAVGTRIRSLQSVGGQPLPPFVRARFERQLGTDLRHVRVHADGAAADLATAIDARAFTVGRDIAFGSGQYAPSTPAGERLLAHELVHVLQQNHADAAPAGASA